MTRNPIAWICLVLLAIGIRIFSYFPDAVELYYSNGFYPAFSRAQRWLFGWIPFSVGDILYAVIVLYLIYKLVDMIRRIRAKSTGKSYWIGALKKFVFTILIVYVSFNLFWGLNYNRRGIIYQLNLPTSKVTKEDLAVVMEQLMLKVNAFDSAGRSVRSAMESRKNFFPEPFPPINHW